MFIHKNTNFKKYYIFINIDELLIKQQKDTDREKDIQRNRKTEKQLNKHTERHKQA